MIRKLGFWTLLSAAVMLGLPWLVVSFVRSDAGMAAVLLLFFAVDPAYCAIAGGFAGKRISVLWAVPLIASLLFLTGTWLFFEMGERIFALYALLYFALGTAAMLVSRRIEKRRNQNG